MRHVRLIFPGSQMGFGGGEVVNNTEFENGTVSDMFWLDGVSCEGNEPTLESCLHYAVSYNLHIGTISAHVTVVLQWGRTSCSSTSQAVGLSCISYPTTPTASPSFTPSPTESPSVSATESESPFTTASPVIAPQGRKPSLNQLVV